MQASDSAIQPSRVSLDLVNKRGLWTELSELLEDGVRDGVFPGAVALIVANGIPVFMEAKGLRVPRSINNPEPQSMTTDTVFDVAAITAGIVTTTTLMRLLDSGRIALNDRVSRYLEGFGVLGKAPVTVRHLLAHTANLPSWHPFFEELLKDNAATRLGILTTRGARDQIVTSICRSAIKGEIEQRHQYSDVGMIALGALIEAITALPLDRAFYRYVAQPLRLQSSSFIDLAAVRRGTVSPCTDMIAATEECSWRKRLLCGEVHDDNAWVMGGIGGHSGLFASALDLHLVADELRKALAGTSGFLSSATAHTFLDSQAATPQHTCKLGWDSPSRDNGLLNVGFSDTTFGYNGFTGCSLWIDPAKDCCIILMSNRICPSRTNRKITPFRAAFTQTALKLLNGSGTRRPL